MHSAAEFALDLAEAAVEDALRATADLPPSTLAAAAAVRAKQAFERVREAAPSVEDAAATGDPQLLEDAIDRLMALADDVARATFDTFGGQSARHRRPSQAGDLTT